MKKIPRISPADVRKLWTNEEKDFTPWLMSNFSELTEKIGIRAINVRKEERTGGFRVDLIGEELDTGRKIVVENQLEQTDHTHLGQLLTYAGGHTAEIVIWISTDFRTEHKRALSWLNSISSDENAFFGIELRAHAIRDEIGYDFDVVVQPDEWAPKRDAYTKKKQRYSDFYTALLTDLRDQGITNATKGNPDTWQNISIGTTKATLEMRFGNDGRFRVAFYIYTSDHNKRIFDSLLKQKDSIDGSFGESLEWERRDNQKHSVLAVYKDITIDADEQALISLRVWATDRIIRLKKSLEPHRNIWK